MVPCIKCFSQLDRYLHFTSLWNGLFKDSLNIELLHTSAIIQELKHYFHVCTAVNPKLFERTFLNQLFQAYLARLDN